LLAVSNLFILKWEMDECIVDPSKRRVFIDYINHNLNLLNWIDKSTRQINERIIPICDLL
jgi:hypothetical protein